MRGIFKALWVESELVEEVLDDGMDRWKNPRFVNL